MRYLLIILFLILFPNIYSQINLNKTESKNHISSFYNKDSSLIEFNYSKKDSVKCISVYDSIAKMETFIIVDKMPFYEDEKEYGKRLIGYLRENVRYPITCGDYIQGKVYIKFIIEPNGKLSNITIVRGLGTLYDEEAMRVMKKMPNWNPGECNGIKVPVYYSIPISFRLEQ